MDVQMIQITCIPQIFEESDFDTENALRRKHRKVYNYTGWAKQHCGCGVYFQRQNRLSHINCEKHVTLGVIS